MSWMSNAINGSTSVIMMIVKMCFRCHDFPRSSVNKEPTPGVL